VLVSPPYRAPGRRDHDLVKDNSYLRVAIGGREARSSHDQTRRSRRPKRLDPFGVLGLQIPPRQFQIVTGLQIEPKLRAVAEIRAEPERGVGRDAAPIVDNLGNPVRRNPDRFRELRVRWVRTRCNIVDTNSARWPDLVWFYVVDQCRLAGGYVDRILKGEKRPTYQSKQRPNMQSS
jgi:hypothetical protein